MQNSILDQKLIMCCLLILDKYWIFFNIQIALCFVCWKDISTKIIGEYFWNTFRGLSKYVFSTEAIFRITESGICISCWLFLSYYFHQKPLQSTYRPFRGVIQKQNFHELWWLQQWIFISLYCNFSLTYWVSWVTQYWNQGCFLKKIYFYRAVPSGKAQLIAVNKGFALL